MVSPPAALCFSAGLKSWVTCCSSGHIREGPVLLSLGGFQCCTGDAECSSDGIFSHPLSTALLIIHWPSPPSPQACLQKKHRRAFTTTEDMNGVCTLLTPDLRSTVFLNLTKMGIGAKPILCVCGGTEITAQCSALAARAFWVPNQQGLWPTVRD